MLCRGLAEKHGDQRARCWEWGGLAVRQFIAYFRQRDSGILAIWNPHRNDARGLRSNPNRPRLHGTEYSDESCREHWSRWHYCGGLSPDRKDRHACRRPAAILCQDWKYALRLMD